MFLPYTQNKIALNNQKKYFMSPYEKALHTKFNLLLNGQGYVEDGIVYIIETSADKKPSQFSDVNANNLLLHQVNQLHQAMEIKR